MKYCFDVEKIIKKTTTVIVEANSLEEAENILSNACDNQKVNFNNAEDEDDFEFYINSDSAKDDDTFDEDNFSDDGIQYLN